MQECPETDVKFYEPYFESKEAAEEFVANLECLCPEEKRHPAKVMMHQVQRLVSLADDIPKIRNGNEPLSLLFLLICAEHVAKLFYRYDKEGKSKCYVKKFFLEFLSEEDKSAISEGIISWEEKPPSPSLEKAVSALYSVRCDVVHEGRYWGFNFSKGIRSFSSDPDTIVRNWNGNPNVCVSLTLQQFRDIVVRGAINAIQRFGEVL